MIKALFFDVDGTLFSHTLSAVPPSALDALERLRERGVLLFLATGRHRTTLETLNLSAFPFDGYITLTGHLCYDGAWNPVFRSPFPEPDRTALQATFESRRVPLLIQHEHFSYMNFVDRRAAGMLEEASSAPAPVASFSPEPVYSAAVFCAEEDTEEMMRGMPACRLSRWAPTGFDIISRRIGKASGISVMMERFGFRREETAAFGDADNDAEMIAFAGVGIAMGNGSLRARTSADYVTSSVDEDGISRAVHRLGIL